MAAFDQYGNPTIMSSNQQQGQIAGGIGQRAQVNSNNLQNGGASDPFANSAGGNNYWSGQVSQPNTTQQSAGTMQSAPNTSAPQNSAYSPTPASTTGSSGINPQLQALYNQYGITNGGAGSGLSDYSYWNSKISAPGADQQYYLNRLQSDLQGNGPDTGSGGGGGGNGPLAGTGIGNVSYTPGQLPTTPFSVYQAPNLTQYQSMDQSGMNNLQNQALQTALTTTSLSPDVVNQMNAQLRDQAATMQQGNAQNIAQNYASLGYSGGGGEAADIANSQNAMTANLMDQFRNTNVNAAEQNYQDRLNALAGSNNVLSGQVNNAVNQWNAVDQGQMNQQQLNQAAIQSQNAATQYAMQVALEQEGLKQAQAGIGVQTRGQDIQSLLGLNQLGYQYANMNNNNQQNALNMALGMA